MSCRSPGCGIVAASFSIISLIISGGVACVAVVPPVISSLPFHLGPSSVSPAPLLALLVVIPRRHLIRHLGQSACLPPCVPFYGSPCVPLFVSPLVSFSTGRCYCRPARSLSVPFSACGHQSPRPACRLGWGRDGTGRLSRHRLPALPPLLVLDGVLPACVSSLRSACSVSCRRLCR